MKSFRINEKADRIVTEYMRQYNTNFSQAVNDIIIKYPEAIKKIKVLQKQLQDMNSKETGNRELSDFIQQVSADLTYIKSKL